MFVAHPIVRRMRIVPHGLTNDEAAAAVSALAGSLPDAEVSIVSADDGSLLVVAVWTEPNGEVGKLTVGREEGRYVLIDKDGRPVVYADDLSEVLGGA
jgi:hypothetical protein